MRALARAEDEVVVADNLVMSHSLRLLEDLADTTNFHHADVRVREDLDRLPSGPYDAIYHLAASLANERSIEHPEVDAATNVIGTLNVLDFARRTGCGLFVYTGSSSSYGAADPPFKETQPLHPETPYAATKLAAEVQVQTSGIPFAIFRLFNVYGPGDLPGTHRNVIPKMLAALHTSDRVIRVLGHDSTRDFTFVDDVLAVLLDAGRARGTVVNVGSGVETSISDLARMLLDMLGLPETRMRIESRRPWDRVVRRCADVSRLRERFGAVPSTPLREGLDRTVRWLAEHHVLAAAHRRTF